jgi:hypothetical protein
MPDPITTYHGGSSYEIGVSPQSGEAGPPAGASTAGDTVEISSPQAGPGTYGPNDVADKFKFDIQNGMFDKRLRYTALQTRSSGAATETYEARAGLGGQTMGGGGVYSALFALQYNDANPDQTQASSSAEARGELNRMAEQRLSLLNSL